MPGSGEVNGANYTFDEFTVDRAGFRLCKGPDVKPLPPRAFDLLLYLIEHRDRVVEKQELFENVWNESFVTDNALTRAIREIRHELEDNAATPRYIATVHKRGYRFIGHIVNDSDSATGSGLATQGDDKHAPERTTADEPSRPGRNNRIVAVGLICVALVAASAAVLYFGGNARQIRSLAILPLENSTGDPDAEYMGDGVTESIINSLSRLPQIKVIPRTTAFRYRRKDIDPQQLGSELGVDAVMTGRITRQADNFVVQTELIDTTDGTQLWGERFSRRSSDVFMLQDEIAKVISEKLQLKLSGEDEKRLRKRYTENANAYEFYLRGRYHLARLTPPEVNASVAYFQRAIEADPAYALAYVGLADAYSALALSVDMPASEFYPKSKAAARKALEIDDTLAEAHTTLGFATQFYDWDFKSAEEQHKRALELDPNRADAHFGYASLLTLEGKHDEALARIERARELDPLNLRINALEGRFLAIAGRVDEGLTRLQKTIELEPNYFLAHLFASTIYAEKGMYPESIAHATKAKDLSDGNAEAIAWIGYALAKSGKPDEARLVLSALKKRAEDRYVPPYNFALVHHGLGERDEAFGWLERGFEQRDPKILFLKSGRMWFGLSDDPRYISLLNRMNLSD